jgi:hypothetical protein
MFRSFSFLAIRGVFVSSGLSFFCAKRDKIISSSNLISNHHTILAIRGVFVSSGLSFFCAKWDKIMSSPNLISNHHTMSHPVPSDPPRQPSRHRALFVFRIR